MTSFWFLCHLPSSCSFIWQSHGKRLVGLSLWCSSGYSSSSYISFKPVFDLTFSIRIVCWESWWLGESLSYSLKVHSFHECVMLHFLSVKESLLTFCGAHFSKTNSKTSVNTLSWWTFGWWGWKDGRWSSVALRLFIITLETSESLSPSEDYATV